MFLGKGWNPYLNLAIISGWITEAIVDQLDLRLHILRHLIGGVVIVFYGTVILMELIRLIWSTSSCWFLALILLGLKTSFKESYVKATSANHCLLINIKSK